MRSLCCSNFHVCAGRNADEQSDSVQYSANMQPPRNPSSVQQEFAFAAGLAAAEDVPLAIPDPAESTQLSQANSMTEPQQPPSQQQQRQDEENKQSITKSAPQSSPESNSTGQPDGQTDGQTNGQTDRQIDRQTLVPGGTDGQASVAKGQLSGDRNQKPDPVQDPSQQPELIREGQDKSWSQPDEHDRISRQNDSEAYAPAESSGSSAAGSSQSSTAVGDDSSSAEVDIEQMSFGERLQAGIDCFR